MARDMDAIKQELEAIQSENDEGLLVPEEVHQWAKENKDSHLHAQLDWDNDTAGHQWRLEQIRRIIRVCVEMIPNPNAGQTHIIKYVSLNRDRTREGGGYRTMVSVMASAELTAELEEQAVRDMNLFANKYSRLQSLKAVFAAMQDATGNIQRKGGRKKSRRRELVLN